MSDSPSLIEGLLDTGDLAIIVYDARGFALYGSPAHTRLFGSSPPPEYCLLEDDVAGPAVHAAFRRALGGETVMVPAVWYDPRSLSHVRVEHGRRSATKGALMPLRDADGTVSMVALVLREITAERILAAQYDVAAALAESRSFHGAIDGILRTIASTLGWDAAAYWSVDRERLVRIATSGADAAKPEGTACARGKGVAGRACDSGTSVWIRDLAPSDEAYVAGWHEGFRCVVAIPVRSRDRVIGCVELLARQFRACDEPFLQMLEGVVRQVEPYVGREREDDARRFLLDASVAMSGMLECDATLREATRLAVPFLSDWCAVDIGLGATIRRVAATHVDPAKAPLLHEIRKHIPPVLEKNYGYAKVVRTGISDFWPERFVEQTRPHQDATLARLKQEIGYASFMCVPLVARGRILGAMTFGIAESGRRFDRDDLALAEDLGRRAGQAVENAMLFEQSETARRRAGLLAEVSRTLTGAVGDPGVLDRVARLVLPELGDTCAIDIVGDDGATQIEIVADVDPGREALARELRRRFPVSPHARTAGPEVRRTGRSWVVPEVPVSMLETAATSAEHLDLLQRLAPGSFMIVPILARDRAIGSITLASRREALRYDDALREIAEDVAQRVGLAVANARLHAALRDAVRAREEFLSVASHEIRTPLTALDLLVRTLDSGGAPIAPDAREKLDMALRLTDRMNRLVARLFDLSRLTAGRTAMDLEELDLAQVCRECVGRMAPTAEQAGCTIELHLEGGAGGIAGRWDRFHLDQILTNLLANALKFGAGRPVQVSVKSEGGDVILAVCDRGIGIEPQQLDRIFERFTRAVNDRDVGGLGLGLYLVRQAVESLSGEVRVRSTPGEGATFTVRLPKRTPDQALARA